MKTTVISRSASVNGRILMDMFHIKHSLFWVRSTQKQWFAQCGLLVHGLMERICDGENQLSVKYYLWVSENAKATSNFVMSCLESAANDLVEQLEDLDQNQLQTLDP